MARDYDHLFKLLIIGDSGECGADNCLDGGRGMFCNFAKIPSPVASSSRAV